VKVDIKTIKHQIELGFEINQKNSHVLSDSNYLKQNMYVTFETLYWLIEQAEKVECYEKALEEINQTAVYYDEKGWALNPDRIGKIVVKALDR
jgi:hypothetical protein